MIRFKADFSYKNKVAISKLIKSLNGNPYVSGLSLSGNGDEYKLTVSFCNETIRDIVAEEFNGKKE